MTVYSYISETTLITIADVANEPISTYADYIVSSFAFVDSKNSELKGSLEERVAYDYNEDSRIDIDEIPYGSITDTVTEAEDYGLITGSIDYYDQIEDFGLISINTTEIPFGRIRIRPKVDESVIRVSVGGVHFALFGRAATEVIFNPVNRLFDIEGLAIDKVAVSYIGEGTIGTIIGNGISSVDSVGFNPPESTLLFKFTGQAVTEPVFNEVNRIFDVNGNVQDSIAYSYNQSSVVTLESTDYGFVSEIDSLQDDYGLVTDQLRSELWQPYNIDYGFLEPNDTSLPYGESRFVGSAEESNTFIHVSDPNEKRIIVSGTALDRATPKQIGVGEIKVTGTPRIGIIIRYKADGGQDEYPQRFRGGSLFGFSSTTEVSAFVPQISGELFSINSSTTFSASRSEVGVSDEDILIRGNANYIPVFNKVDRLISFGNQEINRRTYSYNESSIVNTIGIDYGLVAEFETSSDDFGILSDNPYYPWEEDDYGFLLPDKPIFPYGKLEFGSNFAESSVNVFVGSGSVEVNGDAKVYVLPKHNGSGLVKIFGSAVEKNSEDYVGSGSLFGFIGATESILVQPLIDDSQQRIFTFVGESEEKYGKGNYDGFGVLFAYTGSAESYTGDPVEIGELFKFFGSAVEKNSEDYVGSGSLFGFSGGAERVAYSYNESSIVTLESVDYGFVSESPISQEDFGLVSEPPQSSSEVANAPWLRDDYGYLTPNDTKLPYGQIRVESGTDDSRTSSYVGSARVLITGEAEVYVTPQHIGSGFINIDSDTLTNFRLVHNGSGSLFGFVGAGEVVAYDYNESSVVTFDDYDYGDIDLSVGPEYDYGDLSDPIGIELDYGDIGETTTKLPFGLFKFSGSAVERNTESYDGSGRLFNFDSIDPIFRLKHIGSGSISIFGSAQESVSPATHVTSGTLELYVSVKDTTRIRRSVVEVGSGILYGFISATETNTESYVGTNEIGLALSGQADIVTTKIKFGSGTVDVNGSAVERNTESYVGLGTVFVSNVIDKNLDPSVRYFTEVESISWNPPEVGSLFGISGSSAESTSESNYNGSGSLFTFGTKSESISNAETSKELFRVVGTVGESYSIGSYFGSGSLFSIVSSVESISANPPETTELFNIEGSAIEKNVESYVGTGSLFTIVSSEETRRTSEQFAGLIKVSGSAQESISPTTEIGSGSLFAFVSGKESTAIDETSRELFKFSGFSIEKNSESYNGSGELSIDQDATTIFKLRYIGSGTVQVDSDTRESVTPALEIGSGTIFNFVSSTETFVANPPETTELFRFSGTAEPIIRTQAFEGSGSIFSFISSAETIKIDQIAGGLFKFVGTVAESISPTYVGSGSVFTFVSSSETTSSTEVSSGLFRISSSSTNSFTPTTYVGSGSAFTFVSSTESRTSVDKQPTELFRFSGTAEPIIRTQAFEGSGSIFSFISSSQSKSSTVPEPGDLFRITGSANEARVVPTYDGSGSIFTFVSSSETTASAESPTPSQYKFFGTAEPVLRAFGFNGSGSVFTFVSSTTTRTNTIDEISDLFKFSGTGNESFAKSLYIAEVSAALSGISFTKKVDFVPGSPTRIIII